MSELSSHNPNEDKLQEFRQARKFDATEAALLYQQMADRFQADGDIERAKQYRELAKKHPTDKEISLSEDQRIKEAYTRTPQEIADERSLHTNTPTDWRVQAIKFTPEQTEALQRALKAKANKSLQRQVQPPKTK